MFASHCHGHRNAKGRQQIRFHIYSTVHAAETYVCTYSTAAGIFLSAQLSAITRELPLGQMTYGEPQYVRNTQRGRMVRCYLRLMKPIRWEALGAHRR